MTLSEVAVAELYLAANPGTASVARMEQMPLSRLE